MIKGILRRLAEPKGNTQRQKIEETGSTETSQSKVCSPKEHDVPQDLRYDFRLETKKGVLKSWAVTKKASLLIPK